jgi:hypothetical protein
MFLLLCWNLQVMGQYGNGDSMPVSKLNVFMLRICNFLKRFHHE